MAEEDSAMTDARQPLSPRPASERRRAATDEGIQLVDMVDGEPRVVVPGASGRPRPQFKANNSWPDSVRTSNEVPAGLTTLFGFAATVTEISVVKRMSNSWAVHRLQKSMDSSMQTAKDGTVMGVRRSGLNGSMVLLVVQIYHAYFLFCSMIVGFILGVHLMLTWFVEWLRSQAGRADGYSGLPLDLYLAVFMRSWLMIRLFSSLIPTSAWLASDALRLEPFQVYRRTLCGNAAAVMKAGSVQVIGELAKEEWRYAERHEGRHDLLAQALIFLSFDVYPVSAVLLAYSSGAAHTLRQALRLFVGEACNAACLQVALMHAALTVSDLLAKRAAWRSSARDLLAIEKRKTTVTLSQDVSPWNMIRNMGSVTPSTTRPSTRRPSASTNRSSQCETEDDEESSVGERRTTTMILEELNLQQVECEDLGTIPMNIYGCACMCIRPLMSAFLKTIVACSVVYVSIWRLRSSGDPLAIMVLALLLFGVCAVNANLMVRLSRDMAERVLKRRARSNARSSTSGEGDDSVGHRILNTFAVAKSWHLEDGVWRRVRRLGLHVQKWGQDHCGLDRDYAKHQYDVLAVALFMQAGLFDYIAWSSGACCMFAIGTVVVIRRLTYRWLEPFSALVAITEAFVCLIVAVALNGFVVGWKAALGTLVLALGNQMTLARQECKSWRARRWLELVFPFLLVGIAGLSFLSLQSDTTGSSNLCLHESEAGRCRYINTSALANRLDRTSALCNIMFTVDEVADTTHRGKGIGMVDFAMLCKLSYESNSTFERGLNSWFPGWRLAYQRRVEELMESEHEINFHDIHDWTTFFELHDPANKTTVFLVRGTQTPLEAMLDLTMYAPVAMCQIVGMVAPAIPVPVIETAMRISSHVNGLWAPTSYYSKLLQHVRARMLEAPDRRYYLTGHSLGGGIASLVASETGVQAVTFSAPGTRVITEMNENARNALMTLGQRDHELLYTVVPDHDIIPMVDEQLGTQIRVPCEAGAFGCHLVGETMCQLLRACGPNEVTRRVACQACPAQRDLFPECNETQEI